MTLNSVCKLVCSKCQEEFDEDEYVEECHSCGGCIHQYGCCNCPDETDEEDPQE